MSYDLLNVFSKVRDFCILCMERNQGEKTETVKNTKDIKQCVENGALNKVCTLRSVYYLLTHGSFSFA